MQSISDTLMGLAKEAQTLAPVLATLAFIIVGVCFIVGTKQMKEGAKVNIYYILGGVILVCGAVNLGAWLVAKMTF
jgi:hypothetical protein